VEQQLKDARKAHAQYRAVLEFAPYCMGELDVSGQLLTLNRAGRRALGLPDAVPLENQFLLDIVDPRDRESVARDFQKVLDGTAASASFLACNGRYYVVQFTPIFENQRVERIVCIAEDTTDWRLAEENRQTDREVFRSVLNRLAAPIVVIDREGVVIMTNVAWLNRPCCLAGTGSALPEIGIGDHFLKILGQSSRSSHEQKQSITDGIARVLSGESSVFHYEYHCQVDDRTYWYLMQVTPLGPPTGGAVLAHWPVTELKQAERALRSRESRLSAVLETAAEGVITIDEHGLIETFNAAASRIFGYNADEVIGQNVRMLMPSPDCERHDSYITNYLRSGRPQIIGVGREVLGKRRDGSIFPMFLSVSEAEADRRLFVGLVRDLSAQKEAEMALRRQEEQFRVLASNVPELFAYVGTDQRYRFVNHRYEELFNRKAEAMLGRTIEEVFGPESYGSLKPQIDEVLAGREVNEELELELAGHHRWVSVKYVPHHDDSGELSGFFTLASDVTDLHLARQRAVQAERLSAIGEAMTGLTHESRNALARSQANLRRLSRRLRDRPDLVEFIDAALDAQEDVRRLFEEVRQYASPPRPQWESADLAMLLNETWYHLESTHRGRDAHIQQQTDGLDLSCRVDRFSIRNAFRNLLENALAACRDPVRITVTYREISLQDHPALEVSIRDNGPGLLPEQRQRAFDAFYTTKTHGTGLGLAIVRRAVELHGGDVSIGDDTTTGAEFIVRIPREPS
jgi:PAS domain S-box-containing protein